MKSWQTEFDQEFNFIGIEHQLEGEALRQDLKSFIRKTIAQTRKETAEEVINEIPDTSRGQLNDILKSSLRSKFIKK